MPLCACKLPGTTRNSADGSDSVGVLGQACPGPYCLPNTRFMRGKVVLIFRPRRRFHIDESNSIWLLIGQLYGATHVGGVAGCLGSFCRWRTGMIPPDLLIDLSSVDLIYA